MKPRDCVFKTKYIYSAKFYNWDVLLWMKLDKMTSNLRFVGLGKYSWGFFVFVFFKDTEMNPAGELAGSQTAVLA